MTYIFTCSMIGFTADRVGFRMLGLRFLWDYSPIRAGRGSSPEAATFALESNLLGDQDLKEAAAR